MFRYFKLCAVLVLTVNARASLGPTVIYGEDNRLEVYEVSNGLRNSSKSVAAQFHKSVVDGGELHLQDTLGRSFRLCSDQRFYNQPIGADCSAFLVDEDILVTAGHCLDLSRYDVCKDGRWVFDYQMNHSGSITKDLFKEQVYSCKKVLYKKYNSNNDFAVIQLDRKVSDRPVLKIAKNDAAVGDRVVMLGFPSGLPLKITPGGEVLKMSKTKLVTNLDAFHSNSGSAVLDEYTREVVGILVEGTTDYSATSIGCNVVNQCKEFGQSCIGRQVEVGERVSKVSQFGDFLDIKLK